MGYYFLAPLQIWGWFFWMLIELSLVAAGYFYSHKYFVALCPTFEPHWDAAQLLKNSLILPKNVLKLIVGPRSPWSLTNPTSLPMLHSLPSERFFGWCCQLIPYSWYWMLDSFTGSFPPCSVLLCTDLCWLGWNSSKTVKISSFLISHDSSDRCLASLKSSLHLSHFQRLPGWG